MGNSATMNDPLTQIDLLNVGPEEKRNLQIYVWRASSLTNQHIPRTSLNFQSVSEVKIDSFSCGGLEKTVEPNISFEKYVCDFRPLIEFLDLSQSLTLFQSVLKGHKSIFFKLNSSIIHEKCCFLTHDGQARIWINPNYFLNEFWTFEKKQFRLRPSSALEMNCQTPRFMNKQEFEFQAVNLLTSQGVIIRKIIEWMPKFVKKSKESIEFWAHLQKFVQGNMLNNCSFDRVERFIHMWAYQKKITIKAKIEDTVQKLVEEGKILKNRQKSFDQSSKRRLSTIQTDERRKSPPNLNITIDHEFNGVSVFDIRNVESQHIYVDNQNFSQILGKSSHSGNHSLGTISKEKRSKVERSSGEDKISIKDKKSNHQRKISRSFMPQQIQPQLQSVNKIEQPQSTRSVVYQNVDFWAVKSKDHSLQQSRFAKNNLNISYQYSISLINCNTNKVQQNESGNKKKNLQVSTDISERNKIHQLDQLRPRNNSKTGPILKNGQMKSFQVSRQRILNENQREIISKKKHPVIFDTQIIPMSDESCEKIKIKELRLSTFGPQSSDDLATEKESTFKSVLKDVSENQLKTNLKACETKRTADRTRINSFYDAQKGQKVEGYPFKQITNYQLSSNKTENKNKLNVSNTSIYPGYGSTFKGQTSMMLNVKYLEDRIQEDIIRSKRRISVGAEGDLQKRLQVQFHDEYGKISIINHPAEKTPIAINSLFSSQNKLQTSFGSISSASNQFSSQDKLGQKYSGILSKMGRSVQFRKIPQTDLQKPSDFVIASSKTASEEMPNFIKKKTICEHGSKRSMKF